MTSDCAIQIVQHVGENRFKAKNEALKKIYGNERIKDLPLVVLCIAGAARKGKSFMLNFFLDYLILKETSTNKTWVLDEKTQLNGFEFQDGEDPTTIGIWAWSHIFIIKNSDSKEIAFSLIDSQGTFDSNTSYEDCSSIFAMTSMFSSIMCFNVFTDLQEDKLNDFTAFIDHGKKIVENLDGSGKLFQNLVFIIRDFSHFKHYSNEKNGGQKYVEKMLGEVKNKKLQKVRDNLKESYEQMFGFVFPYPGETVAQEKTSKISEMNPIFVEKAKEMVETLLSSKNLKIKKLGSEQFSCKDLTEYISKCVECFNENPNFAPQAVQSVNRQIFVYLKIQRAIEMYERFMDEFLDKCKIGYDAATLQKNHDSQLATIKKHITDSIKDENIKNEILLKIMEELQRIFPKYVEQNRLLVENEKKRLDIIKQKELHEKELARKKAEHDQEMATQKNVMKINKKKQHDFKEKMKPFLLGLELKAKQLILRQW